MAEQIRDGTGEVYQAGVTSGNRLMTDAEISETIPTDGTKNNPNQLRKNAIKNFHIPYLSISGITRSRAPMADTTSERSIP